MALRPAARVGLGRGGHQLAVPQLCELASDLDRQRAEVDIPALECRQLTSPQAAERAQQDECLAPLVYGPGNRVHLGESKDRALR